MRTGGSTWREYSRRPRHRLCTQKKRFAERAAVADRYAKTIRPITPYDGRAKVVTFRTGDPMPTIAGSCLCGAVRYASSAEPVLTAFCHCRDCQKSGGGYSVNVAVPTESLTIEGETRA